MIKTAGLVGGIILASIAFVSPHRQLVKGYRP